jgi:hypothetical protein
MRVKMVETKKDAFLYALDKLRVMFEVSYNTEDFQKIKMFNLNPDQLLMLLASENFTRGKAPLAKVVECLEHLRKSKSIRLYKEREEVIGTVRDIALDHTRLSALKTSYVTSFVNAVARMGIDDEEVWASLAAYLIERCETFDERDLSTHVYALYHAGKNKPIILNFDDLFKKYELQLVKKFEMPNGATSQSISNAILSYSKTQNGSLIFFRILEGVIIK